MVSFKLLGQFQQTIGFSGHCRKNSNDLVSLAFGGNYPAGNIFNPLNASHRRSAIFLYYQCHNDLLL